ncbi:MAG: NAD(P)(+) transhydrogenase (Re/Si-specific) subunit alpha, partial [Rhodospirillaceae bacterium]|nr:NAD(P)(+) transhydrogenase (Re/Si-specific) subunit alpha [Rhodospirillaceae bacterium]
MKIGVPKERRAGETRVAISPDTVKKYVDLGIEVAVETGAGDGSNIPDQLFQAAGATIAPDAAAAIGNADLVLKVQRPLTAAEGNDELAAMKSGTVLVAMLAPHAAGDQIKGYAAKNIVAFAMEMMPRITRAQAMDVLSSQSNLAGYRAVIDAAHEYGRAFPMMMTAAGTIAP